MATLRIQATVEQDGELHLRDLPFRKGEQVEAVLSAAEDAEDGRRWEARERFLQRARSSGFRSTGPYPSREELHERS